MRTCSSCQVAVAEESETCPRCGALVPRGVLSSLRSLFGRGASRPPAPQPPESPTAAGSGGFRLQVEDVFSITGRGTVVTGRVASGEVRVGDRVRFQSPKGAAIQCNVNG